MPPHQDLGRGFFERLPRRLLVSMLVALSRGQSFDEVLRAYLPQILKAPAAGRNGRRSASEG